MKQTDRLLNFQKSIILDILSRLPHKTISQCRCVCKTFLKLISSPDFIHLHLSRSHESLLLLHQLHDQSNHCEPNFTILELQDEPENHRIHSNPLMQFELRKCIPDAAGFTMVGFVNGLICLNDFENDRVYVCNPTTREFITLAKAEGENAYPSVVAYGFGLGNVNDQYKVVRIFQERRVLDPTTGRVSDVYKSEGQICTLGLGTWRKVSNVPFLHNCHLQGVFLNGNLHWWIEDETDQGSMFISCFDVEEELFKPFSSPPDLSKKSLGCLGVLRDQLCICDNTSSFEIIVWVMNDYGEKTSWCKEMVIEKSPILPVGQFYEVVYALKMFEDGEVLFAWQESSFFSYHPASKTVKILDISEPNFEAKIYSPSFISLKKFVKEEIKMF